VSSKFNFTFESKDRLRPLPRKIIVGQQETETLVHVTLKMLGFVLFFRDRLQIEPNLHMDTIPFVPDLVQLDYELRPRLWVECGECSVAKLHKLAVKVPDSEIWILKRSLATAEDLLRAMAKAELRRDRYGILALDATMFEEMVSLVSTRNEMTWVGANLEEEPSMQFDFNGLWFDAPLHVLRF
jgi:hypothetical protein